MNALLEFFRTVDFSSLAQKALSLLDTADPCFVAVVLGVLTLLGSKMAAPYPALMSWGLRLGAAAFLGYLGYSCFTLGGLPSDQVAPVLVRSLVAAGAVLAPVWTVLPVLAFVYGRLRLALAAFLGYVAYECISLGGPEADGVPALALRGAVAAGLALVVAWIFQPVIDFFAVNLLGWRREPAAKPETADAPRAEGRPTVTRVRTDDPPRAPSPESDPRHRRRRARLKAELCYTLHEGLIGDRFTRQMFEEFLDRYLADHHEPEQVEEYVSELELIIRQYAGGAMAAAATLTDLTRWLLDEQERIHSLERDEGRRRTRLAGLNRRYTQLAEQLLDEPAAQVSH
jgi:hypothetical protein